MRRARNGIGYHPEFDGLRAVAILAILVFHTKLAWFPHVDLDGGLLGVDLFFVLSGFLITSLLTQEHFETGRLRRARFYARRFLRLMPALLAVLVLGGFIAHTFGNGRGAIEYPKAALAALLFAGNWFGSRLGLLGHLWFLAVQEQYYLVWPLVLGLALRRHVRLDRLAAALAVTALVVAGMRGVFDRSLLHMADPRMLLRFDGILVGSALALFLCGPRQAELRRLLREPNLAPAALICAAAIAAWATRPDLRTYDSIIALDVCFAVVIGHVFVNKSSVVSRFLRTELLQAVGIMSYGLFLFHWPLFILATHVIEDRARSVAFGWATSFIAAGISYMLIESPALKLKVRVGIPQRDHRTARRRRALVPARAELGG